MSDTLGARVAVAAPAAVAARAGVGRLVLYHHDPMRTDPEVEWVAEMARTVIGKPIPVTAAREGAMLSV